MIVGEGLIGVLIAAIVAFSGKNYPLALVGPTSERRDLDRRRCLRRDRFRALSLDFGNGAAYQVR